MVENFSIGGVAGPMVFERHRETALVSVIMPTFDEQDNVGRMHIALGEVLADVPFEMVFVNDDSTDGTRDRLVEITVCDPRVRVFHRIGRRDRAGHVEAALA